MPGLPCARRARPCLGQRPRFNLKILALLFLAGPVHAAAPMRTALKASSGRQVRIADPRGNMPGYMRGTKSAWLLRPEEITPAALFGKDLEPDLRSFGQGGAGDCYALSAAKVYGNRQSKFYATQKEVLKAVFLEADGTLRRSKAGVPQARFFRKSRSGYVPVLVDYDGKVPMTKRGVPVYAAEAHANGQAWGPLFEAAFAKFRGTDDHGVSGYLRIGNGGSSSMVMEALTGQSAEHFEVTNANATESIARIDAALGRGDVVTTGTNTLPVIRARLAEAIAMGLLDRRSQRLKLDDEKLVVPAHEYGVTRASAEAVETVNPWNYQPVGRKGAHGVGTVKKALYPVLYGDLDIGRGVAKDRATP